jgi:hypothetical protein
MQPIFLDHFYHAGRRPELQRVHYPFDGNVTAAADYFLAGGLETPENLRHRLFVKLQIFMYS